MTIQSISPTFSGHSKLRRAFLAAPVLGLMALGTPSPAWTATPGQQTTVEATSADHILSLGQLARDAFGVAMLALTLLGSAWLADKRAVALQNKRR
jgi:hypothetical protein